MKLCRSAGSKSPSQSNCANFASRSTLGKNAFALLVVNYCCYNSCNIAAHARTYIIAYAHTHITSISNYKEILFISYKSFFYINSYIYIKPTTPKHFVVLGFS